jgi:hypothetical protein
LATAYSVVRKPANGVGIMLVSASAGTLADWTYGWNVGCRHEVLIWQRCSYKLAEVKANITEKLHDGFDNLETKDSFDQHNSVEFYSNDAKDPKI